MTQNYINHIALVLDASGSMQHLRDDVIRVAENQIEYLARRSKELDQETRVTVYSFSGPNDVECLVYDKDVLRLPSLQGYRNKGGMTALLDATARALDELSKIPALYGDHAFLTYVLTDGEENASVTDAGRALARRLAKTPDNWTLAIFVPDQNGVFEAKKFGFLSDNISVWDTSAKGMREVGESIRRATDTIMRGRVKGIRGSRNLFTVSTEHLTKDEVSHLDRLHVGQYRLFSVLHDIPIVTFMEDVLRRPYKVGEAYYQLTKKEVIQSQKKVALYDKLTRVVFVGDEARRILRLPDFETRVEPSWSNTYDVYVQSTSVNRKLKAGTNVLVLS